MLMRCITGHHPLQVLTSLEGFDPLQWGLPPFPVEGAAAAPAANGAAA